MSVHRPVSATVIYALAAQAAPVEMRHCPGSEECKGINTSFPRNAFDSSFFFDGWAVGPLGPGKMSKV